MTGPSAEMLTLGRVPSAASAAFHESPRIMLAAVKFFLGQDEAADNSDDEGDEDTVKAVNPTKAEIYNASKKARITPMLSVSNERGESEIIVQHCSALILDVPWLKGLSDSRRQYWDDIHLVL